MRYQDELVLDREGTAGMPPVPDADGRQIAYAFHTVLDGRKCQWNVTCSDELSTFTYPSLNMRDERRSKMNLNEAGERGTKAKVVLDDGPRNSKLGMLVERDDVLDSRPPGPPARRARTCEIPCPSVAPIFWTGYPQTVKIVRFLRVSWFEVGYPYT